MFELTEERKAWLRDVVKTRQDVRNLVEQYFPLFANAQDYSQFWDYCMECVIRRREDEKNLGNTGRTE